MYSRNIYIDRFVPYSNLVCSFENNRILTRNCKHLTNLFVLELFGYSGMKSVWQRLILLKIFTVTLLFQGRSRTIFGGYFMCLLFAKGSVDITNRELNSNIYFLKRL